MQVHSAADEAKRAYGRKYQSSDGETSAAAAVMNDNQYRPVGGANGPSFTHDDDKLINNYTNKVSLQMKYQTIEAGGDNAINNDTRENSLRDDLSDEDRQDRLSQAVDQRPYFSEFDHQHKEVRLRNLIDFFYE